MRGLIKRWARQHLYSDGPKAGERSKQYPASRSVQGNQPGLAGSRMSSEESNEIFALALDGVSHARFAPLLNWTRAPISETGEAINSLFSVTHVWSLGEAWCCGADADVARVSSAGDGLIVFEDDEEFEWKLTGASNWAPRFVYGTSGLVEIPRVFAFGRTSTSGQLRMLAWGTLQNLDPSPTTTNLALGAMLWGPLFSGFDAGENQAIVGVRMVSSDVRVFRADTTASNVLVEATTTPLPSTSVASGRFFAHGNGLSLALYSRGTIADEIVCVVSEDGGDTWDTRDEPPWGSTGPAIVSFVDFVEDFLGLGPRFVALIQQSSAEMRIVHSADGTDWQSLTIPVEISGIFPTSTGATGAFLGDTLVFCPNGVTGRNSRIYAYDLRLGRAFAIKPTLARILRILWDGCRFWAVTASSDGGTGEVYFSGALVEPSNMFGGKLTDD